jgi:hypothetical protein
MSVSRRSFLGTTPFVFAPALWSTEQTPSVAAGMTTASPAGDAFPSHAPDLAREIVGASHNNISRVKELLAIHPTLARASWDWGFGDWEEALGAASHVGNTEIAAVLLAHGARPTIFSAAMLGQLETVRAFITASPGIEATPGPHGITLLRHALAGGPAAQAVADYLQTLPGANRRPETQPLTPEAMAALTGEYVYGAAADERITIAVANGSVTFARMGRSPRVLVHVGDHAFFPVGAPLVRIRFVAEPAGAALTVHDPDLVVTARRAR